jgi:NADPH:quinone reductase-like Zn-dependent oxidoreductase
LAEYRICREDALVRIPDHLDDAQAAALPCAAVTAWSALVRLGAIKAGDTVLIQGTGGVSLFALQFATLMGAETIVTSSSDAKLERVRSMGATHTINYRQEPEWGKLAAKLTGGRGVDLVVEVGGAGTLPQSLRAVRVGGQISLIGVLSGAMAELPLGPVVTREVRLQAVTLGSRQDFNDMMAAIDTGKLEPVVDRRFSFSEFRDAYAYLRTGQHFGKICIDIA